MMLFDKEQAQADVLIYLKGNPPRDVSDRIGLYINKMYEAIKAKPEWKHYDGVIEDMLRSHAIINMVRYIHKYNPEQSSLYSYLQMVCITSFYNALKEYKRKIKSIAIHDKSLTDESYGESYDEPNIA